LMYNSAKLNMLTAIRARLKKVRHKYFPDSPLLIARVATHSGKDGAVLGRDLLVLQGR